MVDMEIKEVSEKWRVSQATVQQWRRDRKITPQPTQDKKVHRGMFPKMQFCR